MASKRHFQLYLQIDADLHQWILDTAAKEGEKFTDFVVRLLDNERSLWEDEIMQNPVITMNSIRTKMNRERRLHQQALELRNIYLENQTSEAAELLREACDQIGIDYEEFVEEGSRDPFASIAVSSTETSLIEQCLEWLFSTFKKNRIVAKTHLDDIGLDKGFNEKMLSRARKRLNSRLREQFSDQVQVMPHRIGSNWVWYFDDGTPDVLEELVALGARIDPKLIEIRKEMSPVVPSGLQLQYSRNGKRSTTVEIVPGIRQNLDEMAVFDEAEIEEEN